MKVFIAGPRVLSSLDKEVQNRLLNIIDHDLTVIVGDANGIDQAVQQFLHDRHYRNVIVYASRGKSRNNLGDWPVEDVAVPDKVKGFDFYAAKDIKMTRDTDYGFMIWNGKSKGTFNNIVNLTKQHKKVLLYFTPHKKFYVLKKFEDIQEFAMACGNEVLELFTRLTGEQTDSSKNAGQLSLFAENRRETDETTVQTSKIPG